MRVKGMRRTLRRSSAAVIRGRLFLSSYAPLFAILAARTCPGIGDDGEPLWAFLLAVALTVVGLLDMIWLVSGARRRSGRTVTPLQVDQQGAAVAGYLPTYLLPFVGIGPQSTGGWIGYGIYIGVLFVVFLGSDFALVNPTLYLFGRRVTRITLAERTDPDAVPVRVSILVVSTRVPRVGEPILLTRLAGCWVEKERDGHG